MIISQKLFAILIASCHSERSEESLPDLEKIHFTNAMINKENKC